MTAKSIDLHATLKLQPNSFSVDMDGEKVTMNMDNRVFYGINGIGSLIISLIEEQQGMTVEALLLKLTDRFSQGDPEQIRTELMRFLNECKDFGVLLIN